MRDAGSAATMVPCGPSDDRTPALAAEGASAAFELDSNVLAGMFRLAPDMLAIASFDGRFLAVNGAWESHLGWDEADLLGVPFIGLVHPDDVEATLAESQAMESRGSAQFLNRYRRKGGGYRWLEWVSEPHLERGVIYAIARDVTDRVEAETALRATERRHQVLLENLPDVLVVLADADLRCAYMAGGALTKAGIRSEDYAGHDLHDIYEVYGDRRQDLLDGHIDAAAGTPGSFSAHSALSGAHYDISVVPFFDDSEDRGSMLVAVDVTERHQREHELAVASEQLRQTIEHSPIGMAIVGLDGGFLRCNPALCDLVGYSEAELTTLTFQDITHPDDLDIDLAFVQQLLDGTASAYRMDKRYLHASGRTLWVQLAGSIVRDAEGVPVHFVAQIEDISQRKLREVDLTQRAERDGLTGLLNRAVFDHDLEAFSDAARKGDASTLLLIDLDRFKEVNDGVGHAAGDELLRTVARSISGRARSADRCYRIGGDEFAVIVPGATSDHSNALAAALKQVIQSATVEHAGRTWTVEASVGAATVDGGPSADVLAAADRRMYADKRTTPAGDGGGCVP